MSRIGIVGTGYVGLTTGACFAHLGHQVVCADVDADKVAQLSRGEIPIVEHGLDRLVEEGLRSGRLRFVVGAANAVRDCDIAFLCVPTPQGEDGNADLSYIEQAAREISADLPYESVVVNKSTVPVGSTRVVERVLDRPDVKVVSNPEFLREGSAVQDFLKPDRIVVGCTDQSAAIKVSSLYLGVAAPVIVTDPASAETIKYAANAFLATKLSFVNAVAAICEGVGADVNDVVLGLGYDKRIGQDFLRPGPGWGGSCFRGAETLLVRRLDDIRLVRFDQLAAIVEEEGEHGVEALSWVPDAVRPEFQPVIAVTERPYVGPMVTLRTEMGRRLTVTADHPMVARRSGAEPTTVLAGDLSTDHWLPIALGVPLLSPVTVGAPIGVWSSTEAERAAAARTRAERRCWTPTVGAPSAGRAPEARGDRALRRVWRMPLRSGRNSSQSVIWARSISTGEKVRAQFFGWDDSRPDASGAMAQPVTNRSPISSGARRAPREHHEGGVPLFEQVLRDLWARSGSWRMVKGQVQLAIGPVARRETDVFARQLAAFAIVADVEDAPTPEMFRLTISGADQVEDALWLLEEHERETVMRLVRRQSKRIAPTGYRRDGKGTAWVRVVDVDQFDDDLTVYSAEVEQTHTIVTSFGLVAHNCFPKDTRALLKIATDAGYDFGLLSGVVEVNDEQFARVTEKVRTAAGGDVAGRTIAVWGLTFKARTDDLRESPSVAIIERLIAQGAKVRAHDPTVSGPKGGLPAGIEICASPYEVCEGADVLAIFTEWDDYRWLDASKVAGVMNQPSVVDARNLLDRSEWRRAGFTYYGIGR